MKCVYLQVISIVASLMKNCRGNQRSRLVSKFTEADHEKVERVMELHFKYLDKVHSSDEEHASRRRRGGDPQEDEDEAYMRRIENGLFTLQLVDYIIVEACATGAATVKEVRRGLNRVTSGRVVIFKFCKGGLANVPNLIPASDSSPRPEERLHHDHQERCQSVRGEPRGDRQ